VQRVVLVAGVDVINSIYRELLRARWSLFAVGVLGFCVPLMAAVLPEDRADFLFHSYSGGGLDVHGPSILVRKKLGEQMSLWGKYYVDALTSATIDVVTSASKYTERRIEKSAGVDYLRNKTKMSFSQINSVENDYVANTMNFNISQDMFGDLTTVSLGYTKGLDDIYETGNPGFHEKAHRQNYRVGVSQVLTKNFVTSLNYETITDEGYLGSPYQSVRYLNSTPSGPVKYPHTHTSQAFALNGLYYLPYRAAVKLGYRFYTDTWGVQGQTYNLGYTHPLKNNWTLDFNYRYYTQTHANFYSDLFVGPQNYVTRDKELSTFASRSIGMKASYNFLNDGWKFIDKGSADIAFDHIMFDYKDFRDLRVSVATPGTEPLYNFSANVLQLFVSLWY
jgi:hypothetical protein